MKQQHIGFIGFGLIGGSIARCIRKEAPDSTIIVYNARHPQIKPGLSLAVKEGTVDKLSSDLEADFKNCDIIFLCAPVMINIEYLSRLKPIIKNTCIITDVGSVKGNIHKAVTDLDMEANFIGGHPMAGKEKTGYENSSIDLLESSYYLLTPTEKSSKEMLSLMLEIVSICHAKSVVLTPEEHDNITAVISHVPHVIAYSLVNMLKDHDDETERMKHFAAGGFYDITRIASSSPIMWQNICRTNADSIYKFIDIYKDYLTHFQEMLKNGDDEGILAYFEKAKNYRDSLSDIKK